MKHFRLFLMLLMAWAVTGCTGEREISEDDMIRHDIAVEQINQRQFLIKADRLILANKSYPSVSQSTNFIMVDGDKATVQVSPGVTGGPNGVGGFTVKGNVTGYEVKTKDNGDITVKFNVTAAVGSCSVFLNMAKNGYKANASIHNTLRGKNATIYGIVTPLDQSVYVGRTR